jgi:hypothetical protein
MENAARGRFPSHENVEIPYIDWVALNKRLKKQKKQFQSMDTKQLILHREMRQKYLQRYN